MSELDLFPQAVNFTDFCKKESDIAKIKRALDFYMEEWEPEKVLEYFTGWALKHDDSKYRNDIILTNKHSNGKWSTKIWINDNAEYAVGENENCWQYTPKTMSEFISDVLRYKNFELILSEAAIKKIYG